jgi:hypothetical protein
MVHERQQCSAAAACTSDDYATAQHNIAPFLAFGPCGGPTCIVGALRPA